MGKFEKKKPPKRHKGVILALILVVMAAVLAAFVLPHVPRSSGTQPETFETEGTVPTTELRTTERDDDILQPGLTNPGAETEDKKDTEKRGKQLGFPVSWRTGRWRSKACFSLRGSIRTAATGRVTRLPPL